MNLLRSEGGVLWHREHRDLPQPSHQRRKTRLRALSWLPMPMIMVFSWWWILFFFNPFDDENYNRVSETNSCSCCLRLPGTQRLGVPCLCNRNVFWNLKTWHHLMMDPWQVLKRGWWVLTTVFERKICHSSVSLFLCAQIYSNGRWLGRWRIWKKADKEHSIQIIIH